MVRKSLSSKNTPTEKVGDQSNGDVKSPRAFDSELRARCAPLKIPNQSANGAESPLKISSPKQVNWEDEHLKKHAASMKKKSKTGVASVRRSERIKSAVLQTPTSSRSPEYIEDIDGSESENDVQDHQPEKELAELDPEPESEPAENLSEKTLQEKVDYLIQKIDDLNEIIKLLASKADGNTGSHEAPSKGSMSFRSLYISSEKKVEALAEENQLLTRKLENALGKIEVYQKDNRVPIEVFDKLKDIYCAVVAPNRAKTTEAAVKKSTPTTHNASSASAPKRKRKESQKDKANGA